MTLANQTKIGAAILIASLLLTILIGGIGVNMIRMGGPLQTSNSQVTDLLADILPPPEYIIEPWLEVTNAAHHDGTPAEQIAALRRLKQGYEARKIYWRKAGLPLDLTAKLAKTQDSADRFWAIVDERFIPALQSGDAASVQQSRNQLEPIYTEHRQQVDDLVAATNQAAESVQKRSAFILHMTIVVLTILVGCILALVVTAASLLRRRVVAPLGQSADVMERMAGGDLSAQADGAERSDEIGAMVKAMNVFREAAKGREAGRVEQRRVVATLADGLKQLAEGNLTYAIETAFSDEYETLRSSFNAAIQGIQTSLKQVAGSSKSVHYAAAEILAAAEDLGRRTEQQAASLEETAAAMNQITAMVGDSAGVADQARVSIEGAHQDAVRGGQVVRDAVAAMDAIEKSSEAISQIITVIDGIAFQTNLLALNAGVEAARAGESGKGFAVVANEVRALAQRSADAAKEIKDLISTSSNQVRRGVALVGDTGTMLGQIVGKISDTTGQIANIATTAEYQATNLRQINGSVSDMDRMTQQNAAMVEEATACARSLSSEADELSALVSRFRLTAGAATPRSDSAQGNHFKSEALRAVG